MHILLVSQEYPPETAKGGIGSQTFLKARGLLTLGHEVSVISSSPDLKFHEYDQDGVHVRRICGFYDRINIQTEQAGWLTYSAEAAVHIAQIHTKKPVDIIDFPEWGAEGYVHFLNRTSWNYIPAVIQLHGPLVMFADVMGWPEKESEFYRVGKEMEGLCLRFADRIYSSSRCSASWCSKYYRLNMNLIPILHTGIDINIFYPRPVPKSNTPTIAFTGRISRNKGILHLVEAACRLKRDIPDLKLKIIGQGEKGLVNEIKQNVSSQGFHDLLEWRERIPKENLADELSSSHVFAAPSVYEGGPGFVYLEAMACGLPVVACEGSGVEEIIQRGVNGFLVPPRNIDALTGVLKDLLLNEKLQEQMGGRALAYIKEHADSRKCVKQIAAFYEEVHQGCLEKGVIRKRENK